MNRYSLVVTLGLAAALGCGDDAPPTPLEVYGRVQRESCAAIADCSVQWHGYDMGIFIDALSGRCEVFGTDHELEDVLARGYVAVDERAWSSCRAELEACAFSTSAACDRIFVGTQPDGGACVDDLECVSHSCSVRPEDEACGECTAGEGFAFAELGMPCGYSGECAPAPGEVVSCVHFAPGEGTCAVLPRHGEGEACGDEVAFCDARTYCDDGGTCVPRGAPGDACGGAFECMADVYCDRADDEPTGTCRGFELLGVGEGCLNAFPFGTTVRVCNPADDLVCDGTSGRCIRARTIGEGETCRGVAGVRCAEGLRCDLEVCVALLADGETCRDPSDCRSDRCARDFLEETGTCVADLVAGRCE